MEGAASRPLSVCLLAGEFPPAVGGIADYTALLADGLTGRGANVTVFAHRPANSARSLEKGASPAHSVRWVDGWGPGTIAGLARFLRSARCDIVHLQYQAASFAAARLMHGLPVLLRSLGVRARFVTTFHDRRAPYLFPKAGRVRPLALRALTRFSDGTIYTDPSDLIRTRRGPRSAWIPIGANVWPVEPVDRARARARWGFREDEAVVAYFGFLNASKGARDLLHAMTLLMNDSGAYPARLFFIGEEIGSSDSTNERTARELWAEAERLGLGSRIVRTGWLDAAETSQALSAADVAALPYVDGASLRRGSLLACLAHGLPVVTTRPAPALLLDRESLVAPFERQEEYQLDHRVAELVPPGDSSALAGAIRALLKDPDRRDSLGRKGRGLAERLSWPAIARATISFYARLLGTTTLSSPPASNTQTGPSASNTQAGPPASR